MREIDQEIRQSEQTIRELFENDYEPNFGIKSLALDRHTSYGYCLRCSLKDHTKVKRLPRSKVNRVVPVPRQLMPFSRPSRRLACVIGQVLKTLKNRVIFTTTGPNGLADQASHFKDLLADYENKQAVLVKEVLAVAKSYGVVIDKATELIARLDVISSLAHVAVNAPIEYVLRL